MRRAAVSIILLLASTMVLADGPGGYRPREQQPAALSGQRAIDAYNAGYALIQEAEHAESLASAATSEDERNTAQRNARSAYEGALKKMKQAVRFDASMHEAHTYIGYANRKLGRHAEALRAYATALRIYPDYPHAIEYQGEAYLGLNRLDEARFNYLRLYAIDTGQAAKLLSAMKAWIEQHKSAPPAGVDVESFSAWVAERSATAGAEPTRSW